MRQLIGLAGFAGSGKDTVADVAGWRKWPFAEPLRRELEQAINSRQIDEILAVAPQSIASIVTEMAMSYRGGDVRLKPTPTHVRRLLQWYGTEFRRKQDPDYWVKAWSRGIPDAPVVAVTDVRFENEVQAVREAGGIVLVVRRTGVEPAASGGEIHRSERLPMKPDGYFDGVIWNGTLEDLKREVARYGDVLGRSGDRRLAA